MGDRQGVAGIAPVFARMLGARDIALGLGTVIALDRGKPVRGWLEAAALADAADSIASMLGREKLSPIAFKASAVLAAASAGVGMFLARRLDPAPPAHPGQPEAAATGHSTQAP
jgi:peptide-methionine (R)-S-oxide reductase